MSLQAYLRENGLGWGVMRSGEGVGEASQRECGRSELPSELHEVWGGNCWLECLLHIVSYETSSQVGEKTSQVNEQPFTNL